MRENSLPYQVLIILGKLLEFGVDFLIWDYDSLRKRVGIGSFSLHRLPKSSFYRGLSNLKKNNFIKAEITKRGKKIQLTKKGRLEIAKFKIKMKTKNLKWDGKWRGICWDVPETFRKDRNYLRKKLRWLGFKEMQRSLWVFPFDVRQEVKELMKLYKERLPGDVRFLTIEKIEEDIDLRRHFGLT